MTNQTETPTERERSPERTAETDAHQSDAAATYAVLAECWRAPSRRLVKAVEAGALEPVFGDLGPVDLRDLRTEHTRLFIGPAGPPCPPYESVYRDRDDPAELGPVKGPATMAVTRWYREFGVRPAQDHSDLPDHIATELEFAAYLAEEGLDERLEQFCEEHLHAWTEEFTELVEDETSEQFYESLAATTRAVLG
jgi:TorA maturation chaperone TorD